jgi:hypothetical protein
MCRLILVLNDITQSMVIFTVGVHCCGVYLLDSKLHGFGYFIDD